MKKTLFFLIIFLIINNNSFSDSSGPSVSTCKNKTNQKQYQSFQKMIALEKEYSIYLSEKILYLCYKNNTKGIHKIDINKYTNVLSYYIIRAELYNHLNKFLHN